MRGGEYRMNRGGIGRIGEDGRGSNNINRRGG
jgi:hypothetical protein